MSETPDAAASHAEFFDHDGGLRDRIYLIESPSPEDLLVARHEGDALFRTLKLAEIDVVYFMAVDAEMFERAFDEITLQILNQNDVMTAMPFIHISAHGSEDGIELTDGDVILWDKLTSLMRALSNQVGTALLPPSMPQGLPKATLCLSACGVFEHYKEVVERPPPFQALVGPVKDVGWCEALIAYSTFYYQLNVLRKSLIVSTVSMNIAAGSVFSESGPVYAFWNYYEEEPGEPNVPSPT